MNSDTNSNGTNKFVAQALDYYKKSYTYYQSNKVYVNNALGYAFFGLLFFGVLDFSFLRLFYFAGLAYLSAIEYYAVTVKKYKPLQMVEINEPNEQANEEKEQPTTNTNSEDNKLSLLYGWVGYCSLIVFDGIITCIGGLVFGTLLKLLRIVLYTMFSRIYIKFLEDRKLSLADVLENIKSNDAKQLSQHEQHVTTTDNFFHVFFVDMVFVNNIVLGKLCLDYNIQALRYVMNPMNMAVNLTMKYGYLLYSYTLSHGMNYLTNKTTEQTVQPNYLRSAQQYIWNLSSNGYNKLFGYVVGTNKNNQDSQDSQDNQDNIEHKKKLF